MDSTAQTSGTGGPSTPATHPRATGLEAVVASAVKDEIAKHGGGGGGNNGDLDKRVTAIEARLAVIEKTMVTGEALQRELGAVRTELSKVPFETIKWFFVVAGILAAIVFGFYNTFMK